MEDKVKTNKPSSKKFKVSFIVETDEKNWMKKDMESIKSTTGTMLDEFFEIHEYEIEEIDNGR